MFSILTVDDSASMRQLVACSLTNAGYQVFEAADGNEALDCACENQVDFVLTDQNMPILDGVGLTKALRKLPGYQATPIFMMTAEPSVAVRLSGNEAGVTGWIEKPFALQQLVAVVDSFFVGGHRRAM